MVNDIYGYLGFVLVGTTRGIRFAVPDTSGNLTIGALIETGTPVRGFEGQGRFVWFTWERLSGARTGLGRIDLTSFFDADALVPAYATDLAVTSQANVTSVVTFDNKTVFSVAGLGVYVQSTDLVEEGTISPGVITYGLSERKTSQDILVSTCDLPGNSSVRVSLSVDEGPDEILGTIRSSGSLKLLTNEAVGHRFKPKITLVRSPTDPTHGGHIFSGTLRAFAKVEATKYILVTVLLRPVVTGRHGVPVEFDAASHRASLDALWRSQQITTFQEGNQSWPVLVSDYVFLAENEPNNSTDLFGSLQLRLKVVT